MAPPARARGTCHLLQAFDVGFEIDLPAATARLSDPACPRSYGRKRPVSVAEETGSQALRLLRACPTVELGGLRTLSEVELTLFRFGVIGLGYRIPFEGELAELRARAASLYDLAALKTAATAQAEEVVRDLGPAVTRPFLSGVVEDYRIFALEPNGGETLRQLEADRGLVAGILRAELAALAEDEIRDALRERVSYAPDEAVWIDWLAALLIGASMDDERDVLELATAELAATRFLDGRLLAAVEQSYHVLERPPRWLARLVLPSPELRHLSLLQADYASLREVADNPLKLLGDDYLARIYDAASRRFRFDARDAAVERKLATVRAIYSQVADLAGVRRSEILEWIIIALIAIEVVAYLVP